jgi:hypothetical protein
MPSAEPEQWRAAVVKAAFREHFTRQAAWT